MNIKIDIDENFLTLEKKRILVAEDNPLNQLIIGKTLEKTGFEIILVTNGFKVLEALRNQDFDLILMDCQMPELDGYQTTKIIRKSKVLKNSQIPIIAVTANVSTESRKKCSDVGMNDFIPKPIDRNKLYEMLLFYLR